MSAGLQTTLAPTPLLAVLHQQRLYILSVLEHTQKTINNVRSRLDGIDRSLSGSKRQQEHTRPSRATKKQLHHSRHKAQSTLRDCAIQEHALLESLRDVQARILFLQDAALTDVDTRAMTHPGTASWLYGWSMDSSVNYALPTTSAVPCHLQSITDNAYPWHSYSHVDPHRTFSASTVASFPHSPQIVTTAQQAPMPVEDVKQDRSDTNDGATPFPAAWDLSQALRVGSSHPRRQSALCSPRSSRVYSGDTPMSELQ